MLPGGRIQKRESTMSDTTKNWQDYSKVYDLMETIPFIKDLRKKHVSALKQSETILDAGCGTGLITKAIAPNSKAVFGIDTDTNMLQRAITGLSEIQNIHILYGNVYAIPFPDNSFDGYLSNNVMHFIEHPEQLFSELLRVTKPGGTISISAARKNFEMEVIVKEILRYFDGLGLSEKEKKQVDQFVEANRRLVKTVKTLYEPYEVAGILVGECGCEEVLEVETVYLDQSFFVVAKC